MKNYEPLGPFRTFLVVVFALVGAAYLVWRSSTLGVDFPLLSWALYLAEIYGFLSALLHIFMCWRLTIREAPTPEAGKTVDVFITTYNEPVDLVRRTVLAARNMGYPHQTWLLDDGNRIEVRQLADRLGVNYLARTDNIHAKAGNLNHALAHSSGEFIAIFDADHAPQKRFLDRTLGYFQDEKVAFVQTPQDFFNLDSYQHRLAHRGKRLWTEQSLFFKIIQRGKDYWNASFFCGSCAVVRRGALVAVGGFATETVTEDLHTSIRLHKAGYRSVYHHESLAFGIAPGSVAPFLKQRVRWGQGAMQVLKHENIFFTSKLNLVQRLNYLASMLTYFDGWQKGLFYIAPAFVLITGILPISADGLVFLAWFVPYYLLSALVFEEIGRGYGGMFYIEQYNFARFAAFAWATLGLFRKKLKFTVTDKSNAGESGMRRMFFPQIIVLILNFAAVPMGLAFALLYNHLPNDALIFNATWASVNVVLGVAILKFTRSTEKFIRSEYRFPVPLPILMHTDAGMMPATIDNISSNGCKIYGKLPEGLRKGSVVAGYLPLPSGNLEVKAEVVAEMKSIAAGNTYLKGVGCHFVWDTAEQQDALELFLYGSDLQWQLLELEEQAVTPVGWMRNQFMQITPGKKTNDRWAVCEITLPSGEVLSELVGIATLTAGGGAPEKIITYVPLTAQANVALRVHGRMGQTSMAVRVGGSKVIENSLGSIYVTELAPETA